MSKIDVSGCETKLMLARTALIFIAAYGEGETVNNSFDEPRSATIAREALCEIGVVAEEIPDCP